MRGLQLPGGRKIILSDTVGFIADLPTATGRRFPRHAGRSAGGRHHRSMCATLRTTKSEAQKADVLKVLSGLGVDGEKRPVVEVLNKIDLLPPEARKGMLTRNFAKPGAPIAVSALTGEGLESLKFMLESLLASSEQIYLLKLDPADGAALAWAYAHGRVLERKDRATGPELRLAIDPQNIDRFLSHYGHKIMLEQAIRQVS